MTKREVRLEGGAPWGFRMNGGSDSGHPLRISRVNPGSKAAQQGVREGDVISAINGTATRLLTNGDSHALLKSAGSSLTLGLNQDNTSSPKRRSRDLNKRENSAGSSQELNRLNDELDQPKSASSTSSSEPKKQGKKSKPSRTQEEEEEKGESTDKNECEADGEQREEGGGNVEECVENEKKISSSKARRLRKSRAKRKIITSDHLEITITENTEACDTRIEAVDDNVLNDTSCDIAVSNDESHIPSDKTVSISNIEDLESVSDIIVSNTNSDTHDETCISISNNKELNIDKDLSPSTHTSPNTEIIVTNDSNTKVDDPNSPSSKDEGIIEKVEGEPEKAGKIKKKSKKSKPFPLNLECTSSHVVESRIENKIENAPENRDAIDFPKTGDNIKSSNFEEEEIKIVQVSNETGENTKEVKNVLTLNNVASQSEVENDAGLEKSQSSRESILEGSIIKKKKKHKSKSSKSMKVETVEQSSSVEPSGEQLENRNETKKNNVHEGSIVENSSSTPGYEIDFEILGSLKKEERNSIDLAAKSGQVSNLNEVPVKPLNKKSKSKSTKSKITKDREGVEFSTDFGNGNNSSNLSETSKASAVEFPSNIIDLTKSDSHFLHIESSTSNVFNEEFDTDCLKLSSLSRDEVRSPVELVLNPPTPTLASEETFFGPDWESVEEIESTVLGSTKRDVGKKVSVQDSSHSDLRAEVNNLVIVEDFGDDMGLTVDDIRTPIIPPDEEKKLRSFLETLDLVKPDSDYEDDYDIGKDSKEEIVVYRHCTRRSSAEPCYIPPPHRHYLDVITEENSDLSDTDRKSDCDKPWENPELIKKNNDIDEIPDDWGDSDQEVEYPSEEDGGIRTWNGCGTLEEVEGVEIVYLDSDNSDETIIDDRNRELGGNEPKLVVCKTTEMGKRQKIDSPPILVSNEKVMVGENRHETDKIDKVKIIGDERIVEENRNEKHRIDRNCSQVVSNEMEVQSGGKNDDKYIGKENPIPRVIVKETDSQVDEPVDKNSVSRVIVEEKELQVDKPIVDENHISKVIVKEKELKVDEKAQIDLINTIPKSSELVKAFDKIDKDKQDARRRFFSNETYLKEESVRESVSNITPVSVAVSKTFIDQSVEGSNRSRIDIDSKRQNANKDSKFGVGNLDYELIIEDNGRDGSNRTKSEEGRNFSKSVSDEGWDESRTMIQQTRINSKSVQSRNFNNNLETLDLIKVCAKSDGEDRSDSENIYEYIEFRKESDSKLKEDYEEIDSSITNDEEIVVPKPHVKVDVTATPILSRQNSSSSGTMSTQCTSKFNQSPSAWSSENEEKPAIKESSKIFVGNNPESLRELSTKKVISLPNGLRLLEDIGIIQFRSCLDGDQNYFYQNISGVVSPDLTYPPSRPTSVSGSYFHKRHSFSPKSCSVLYTPPRSVVTSPPCSLPPDRERWIGIPTASQNTFVCFSPSQTKSTPLPPGPQEAAGLLDLHKKFIERRGYHEDRWRESSSDLQSPDLIRLEQYSAPVKQRDYTPELLAEAANLLALKEYRESRCLDSKSPDLDTNYDDENKAMKFTIDEVMKMRESERNASPSYNPRSDSKYKTRAISENSRRPNEIGRIIKEGAIPPYNLRNENESTLKLINEDVNKLNEFMRLNRNKESEPTSHVLKNSQEFSTRENYKHKETFNDISKMNQGGTSSCNQRNGGKNKTSIMNEDVEMLNELLKELDIDHSNVDNKNSSTTSTRELKSSIGKHENLNEKFDNERHKTQKLSKNLKGGGEKTFGNIQDKTETLLKKIKEERDDLYGNDRQKTNKHLVCSRDNDLIRNDTQKFTKLSEDSRENDLFETFEWIEGETNQGLVQKLIAKLEKAASGVEGEGDGERAKATESSDDRSRLLALIQSQNDRSVGASLCDGELQLDATCNRRHCNTICGEGRRRSTGSGEMTRGDDDRGDDDHTQGDSSSRVFDADDYKISKRGDIAVIGDNNGSLRRPERPKSLPPGTSGSGTEMFRQKMYEEYMEQVAERFERRQQKVIRLSRPASLQVDDSSNRDSSEALNLEDEFMVKVRERMSKLGINLDDENNNAEDCGDESLPKHLQEFAQLGDDGDGVWSPAQTPEAQRKVFDFASAEREQREDEERERDKSPQPVVWTPKSVPSPTPERKAYRPVKFESPPPVRKNPPKSKEDSPKPPTSLPLTPADWSKSTANRSTTFHSETTTDVEQRLTSSQSADSSLAFSTEINLPRAPNPTITLLQKAREGQLPRGAHYLEGEDETASIASEDCRRPHIVPNEIIYTVKKEYCSEGEDKKPKKIVELGPRKFEGIGPTTKEGIPIVLRSEVKDTNQQKWYKRMYDSLHKAEGDKYVTVRYRSNKKDQYPYASAGGYLSEPDRLGYDSDLTSSKYATLDRRRIRNKEKDFTTSTMPRSKYVPDNSVKKPVDVYKNQPGRIEDYEPGRSSISEKEAKQWWDEVLDIFDEQFEQAQNTNRPPPTTPNTGKPFMTYALKESGYESDSTLVFKRRDENLQNQQAMSPAEQKMAYKTIQKGGEVPLHGLRKPAPERPKEPISGGPVPVPERSHLPKRQSESPHRYVESEVTIHYKSPVRAEAKEALSEEELAQRQAETMRRIYQEERRRKYLQELQDMYSRRHTDNFIPSQKSPIPLNRYDDFPNDSHHSTLKSRDRTPEPKLVARALYNFVGQSSRELTFRRGDIIYVRRQIDKNWFEGEHNAMIGLFPLNHVEIIPYDGIRSMPKRSSEGQARAKFNFQAQTHLELSLVKGELVVLTRRVDENWFEGRIGNRKGIFPVSYVEVLVEPGERAVSPVRPTTPASSKPVASPASHSMILNGGRNSSTHHHYTPPPPVSYTSLSRPTKTSKQDLAPVNQALHIDTQSEPVPYRALYNYKPQNDDELELNEGDLVYVMEKCDDGWYVGSSQRTACFGTFPGNYVQRLPTAQF
ncbi:LOW QUALITY PROTEIN: uncharacterized protein LOC111044999 [Nilaparvata lugens]|uniref:LOW QUALITY PROTEIN: uncharacterized protein LOC111044999 n=1 Tax=Nilaparvata lugens TaxID=108931 RepID=UPI00193DE9C0|nr:LOW QUALITY PROTEIN: uncharacterized protein LOC111044999 [Nilaparvata lugens]